MAPEADRPEPRRGSPFKIGRALKFVEGLLFCCLATLAIAWATDRARGVGFEPIMVTLCAAENCADPVADEAAGPWSLFSETLDLRGLVVFSQIDTCRFAIELLRTRATDAEVGQVLTRMQERGTIIVTRLNATSAIIAPGPNNDGLGDIARDALRWQGGRGCHPSRYRPVLWPLLAAWVLLILWRILRGGRAVLTDA